MRRRHRRLRVGSSGSVRFATLLVREAWQSSLQRPLRLVLTALGVAVGIGSLVATVGLSSTASVQVSSAFNALLATEVGVGGSAGTVVFPAGASHRVDDLPGVVASAVWCTVSTNATFALSRHTLGVNPVTGELAAVEPEFVTADDLAVSGAPLSSQYTNIMAADIGLGLARQLGIGQKDIPVTLLADGQVITVVGVITSSPVDPALLDTLVVPLAAAKQVWSTSSMRDQTMVIRTRPGAAQVVAGEAPVATDPVNSGNYTATAPPDPRQLRTQVETSVEELFIVLAAVALVVSAFGIANTMLVSVIERRSEIGLRRAVGALRRDIVAQFLLESGLTGLAGGVAGSCLGIFTVMAVSVARTWTPVMPVGIVAAAPGLGMLTGMIAGMYPSVRAASVQPIEALRDQ